MRIEAVDERTDSQWEDGAPMFRVFFWTHARSHLSCVDVSDVDFASVLAWATAEAPKRDAEVDIAVRATDAGRPGLIWLVGDGKSGQRP